MCLFHSAALARSLLYVCIYFMQVLSFQSSAAQQFKSAKRNAHAEASREAAVFVVQMAVGNNTESTKQIGLIFPREAFFFFIERFRRVDFALLIMVRVPTNVKPDTARKRA